MPDQLVDRVHKFLLARLAARMYSQGTHLNAREIAEELGVSRGTIKTAIGRLVESGLVGRNDGRRPVVVSFPEHHIDRANLPAFDGSRDSDQAYTAIRDGMLRGDFIEGQFVNAKRLADQIGTTIQSIRQALSQATAAGMFEYVPRRGWRANRFSTQDFNDIYRIRIRLEPLLMKWVVPKISNAVVNDLASRLNALRSVPEAPRIEFRKMDYHFHRTLMRVANRTIMSDTLDPLLHKLFVQPSVRDGYDGPEMKTMASEAESFAEHEAIMEAILQRDKALAVSCMRIHLKNSCRRYVTCNFGKIGRVADRIA